MPDWMIGSVAHGRRSRDSSVLARPDGGAWLFSLRDDHFTVRRTPQQASEWQGLVRVLRELGVKFPGGDD